MKTRLLCVLVLVVFAMGCKDEKKEDKESTEQSTAGAEAGEASGEISCGDVYDNLLKMSETDDLPSKSQFITMCERSSQEQRACMASATSVKGPGPNSILSCAQKRLGIARPDPEEESSPRWERVGSIPKSVTVEVVLADQTIIVAGFAGSKGLSTRLDQRTAEIWRVEEGQAQRVLQLPSAYFVAAARHDDRVWAVQGIPRADKNGSRYTLHQSTDDGKTWTATGEVPAQSVSAAYLTEDDCGWIQGAHNLMRSCDGGKSWDKLSVPGGVSGVGEPIVFSGQRIVLGGKTLRISQDGGATWEQIDQSASAADGDWVANLEEGTMRVGRMENNTIRWLHQSNEELLPQHLAVDGSHVMVVASDIQGPNRPAAALISRDGGVQFETLRLTGCQRAEQVSLNAFGLVYLDRKGQLKRLIR